MNKHIALIFFLILILIGISINVAYADNNSSVIENSTPINDTFSSHFWIREDGYPPYEVNGSPNHYDSKDYFPYNPNKYSWVGEVNKSAVNGLFLNDMNITNAVSKGEKGKDLSLAGHDVINPYIIKQPNTSNLPNNMSYYVNWKWVKEYLKTYNNEGYQQFMTDNSSYVNGNFTYWWYVLKSHNDGWHIDGVIVPTAIFDSIIHNNTTTNNTTVNNTTTVIIPDNITFNNITKNNNITNIIENQTNIINNVNSNDPNETTILMQPTGFSFLIFFILLVLAFFVSFKIKR